VPIWSDDLRAGTPPAWMIELAEQVKLIEPELLRGAKLPTGVIVGSAVIERVTRPDPSDAGALFRLHLTDQTREEVPQAERASAAGLVLSLLMLAIYNRGHEYQD
jgi:hypothetical protein